MIDGLADTMREKERERGLVLDSLALYTTNFRREPGDGNPEPGSEPPARATSLTKQLLYILVLFIAAAPPIHVFT